MWQETNTYSPRPTTLADFRAFELLAGERLLAHHGGTGSVIGGFLGGLDALDGATEAVGVFSAGAWPAAPPDAVTTAALLDGLEHELAAAPAVDGVLVNLHGAMVAAGEPDMERATLARVRRRFGDVPVVAVLDLHGNPSPEAVALCDALIGYRTYPHDDMAACGREAATLLMRALDGERLSSVLGRLPRLTSPVSQATADEPMRGLLARAEQRAADAGLPRISLFPGFPYSDVERAGFGVVAVGHAGEQEAIARDVVAATLADVEARLGEFATARDDVRAAVRRALAADDDARPVVLADLADNIGGGAPGDGTAILAELVARRAAGAVVLLVDAPTVAQAHAAGAGARIDVALGARADDLHGAPVHGSARVVRLGDGRYCAAGRYMTGTEFSMGATAVLELDGVIVVAMTRATPPFHLEQLTASGVDPAAAPIIAVKGAVAWRGPYAEVTGSFVEVDTPGCCPADPTRLPRATAPVAVDPHTTGATA